MNSSKKSRPQWQKELQEAVTDPAELLKLLNLEEKSFPKAMRPFLTPRTSWRNPNITVAKNSFSYSMKVPKNYVNRIQKGNPQDPLLLQILPLRAELRPSPAGFTSDPLGEVASLVLDSSLLHKYQGRALLITTNVCALHCRFCFRRNFPYEKTSLSKNKIDALVCYLKKETSIEELILSGGDPLSLNNEKLSHLIHNLAKIPHLRRLRIHSRYPLVLPSRIDKELAQILIGSRLSPVFVVHANHPEELNDSEVRKSLQKLSSQGIPLLNQSVLLKGINDSLPVLKLLSENLFENKVLPYYLHLLDPVVGISHFNVSSNKAIKLIQAMRTTMPGYLVPRLCKELAGAKSKKIIA